MEEKLKEILCRFSDCDTAKIDRNTVILRDLGLNSYSLVSAANDIEDELGVYIDDSELSTVKTVGDLLVILSAKRSEN